MLIKGITSGVAGLLVAAISIGETTEARQIIVPVDSTGADVNHNGYRTRFMDPEESDPLYDTQWRTSTKRKYTESEVY